MYLSFFGMFVFCFLFTKKRKPKLKGFLLGCCIFSWDIHIFSIAFYWILDMGTEMRRAGCAKAGY